MSEDQQIGFQGGGDDQEEMPSEMQDHMLAAFAHKAGLGPHPGMYKGPGRKRAADPDEPTDTDMQRAQEEPLTEEASSRKMRAAQTGGATEELGPSDIEEAQVKGAGAAQRAAATQQAAQAQAAQAQQTSPQPPPAPAGPVGTTTPYPAQRGPQPPPSAPGGAASEEGEEQE